MGVKIRWLLIFNAYLLVQLVLLAFIRFVNRTFFLLFRWSSVWSSTTSSSFLCWPILLSYHWFCLCCCVLFIWQLSWLNHRTSWVLRCNTTMRWSSRTSTAVLFVRIYSWSWRFLWMNFHWNYSKTIINIFKIIINSVPKNSCVRIKQTVFWIRISFLLNWNLKFFLF